MQIPKLDKIVINMGVGEAKENAKALESAVRDMQIIAGQKPVITKAKKSIANFNIDVLAMDFPSCYLLNGIPNNVSNSRASSSVFAVVTKYEFADRLINLSLPRVRDFRGVNPNAFDGRGNYALGIKEQLHGIMFSSVCITNSCKHICDRIVHCHGICLLS